MVGDEVGANVVFDDESHKPGTQLGQQSPGNLISISFSPQLNTGQNAGQIPGTIQYIKHEINNKTDIYYVSINIIIHTLNTCWTTITS